MIARTEHPAPAPRRRRVALAAALGASLLLAGPPAGADDTHYRDYPLGGRSVGFGGAFVGLGDDPSGIYFNPAGIVDSTKTSVQVSTTLYGLEIADSFFAAVEQVTDLKTVFTELNIIPTSGSFISTIGEPGEDERPVHAYGFGAFVPSYRSVNASNVTTIPEDERFAGCRQLAYQRRLLDRTYNFGGSYARRIDERSSIGVSGFLSYRALRDQEETSCFNDTDDVANAAFSTAQTSLDMSAASVLLTLGLKFDVGDGWTLGGTVTTPGIHVFDTGRVRIARGAADPGTGSSAFTVREIGDVSVDSETGAEVRVGVAYVLPRELTFAADATLHAPVRYKLFDLPASEDDLRDAITLVNDVERRLVVNLAAGAEYLVVKEFSVSGGLFTNFASSRDIPGEPGTRLADPRLPHVNAFGGSFVLGFFGEHTLTRAGLTMSYGDGSDVVPRYAGLAALGRDTEWVKVDYAQLFLFFFVSSTFRY